MLLMMQIREKDIEICKKKRTSTGLLQLMHRLFGGNFMRPLMIFSFLSSSLLPLIPSDTNPDPLAKKFRGANPKP